MLECGEDPLYLARRMVRMASEDIGLAEPGALAVTLAAKDAFDFLGPPKAISPSRKLLSICRSRRNPMLSTPAMAPSSKTSAKPKPIPSPSTSATPSLAS